MAGPVPSLDRTHGGAELFDAHGLGQVDVGAGIVARYLVVHRIARSHHHDAKTRLDGAQAA